jgi:phage tail sheath protein FI
MPGDIRDLNIDGNHPDLPDKPDLGSQQDGPMAIDRQRSTPGVYVTEQGAFPNPVVGVQTAIPAFVGYTETAERAGKPIHFTPTQINSLADYERSFGGAFHATYNIEQVVEGTERAAQGGSVTPPAPDPVNGDADFFCMRQSGSPPVWITVKYNIGRLDGGSSSLPRFYLYNALRLFFANGGGACYIVSVGTYDEGGKAAIVTQDALQRGLDAIGQQSGPTMLVVPDAVLLPPNPVAAGTSPFYDVCKAMLAQCALRRNRVAILDVYGAGALDQHQAGWDKQMDDLVEAFHAGVGDTSLDYGMAYFPFLTTSIVQHDEIAYTNFNIHDPAQLALLQGILDDQAHLIYGREPQQRDAVKSFIADMKPDANKPKTPADVTQLNQNLVNAIPLFKQMQNVIVMRESLMPPGAAMAGVYTATDATRGVWNAPANVVLNAVVTPNIKLNDPQQGVLNVPPDGKAINVIRQFAGRGPVVWGARTLDGNSSDWRYIQVRRTLIYIEQSIDAALQSYVFAANDSQTWVAVTSMVSNFLTGLWAQGGLMGAKADEAFTVSCGLGSTMTPLDVLDGYMIVQISLQMIRPAEFIELTFKQKMQGIG